MTHLMNGSGLPKPDQFWAFRIIASGCSPDGVLVPPRCWQHFEALLRTQRIDALYEIPARPVQPVPEHTSPIVHVFTGLVPIERSAAVMDAIQLAAKECLRGATVRIERWAVTISGTSAQDAQPQPLNGLRRMAASAGSLADDGRH